MWNVACSEERNEFVSGDASARVFARSISRQVDMLRVLIQLHMADYLKSNGGSDMMDLIRFHSNVNNREEGDVVEQRPRAVSFDALSSPDS
jgi:hypothetical protein